LTDATFSPDGRLIATTDLDGVTKLWNIAAPALIPVLEHDGSPIYTAAYTPDGQRLVTGANDFTVRVWDVETGREHLTISGNSLDLDPFDGSTEVALLPVFNESGTIDVWDVNNEQVAINLAGHEAGTNYADVSADGQTMLTVGCDEYDEAEGLCLQGSVKTWDGASGQELQSFAYEAINDSEAVAFELSRDGTRLAIGNCVEYDEGGFECLDSWLTIWDARTGDEVGAWSVGDGAVAEIGFGLDQANIVTTNGAVTRLWNSETGEQLLEVSGRYRTMDPLGQCIVTLTDGRAAMIWDIRTGQLLGMLSGHRDFINSIEFSPDSERLITASLDGTARVWNSRTGVEILNLSEHEGPVFDAHFSPDGMSLVTAGEDGTALIWPFAADKLLELSGPAVQRYSPFLTPTELAQFGLAGN
jgi:WD40 repeat protein